MSESSPCHDCHDSGSDSRLETTITTIDWNAVASIVSRLLEVSNCHWGSQLSGGFNVVHFLHMDDENCTKLGGISKYNTVRLVPPSHTQLSLSLTSSTINPILILTPPAHTHTQHRHTHTPFFILTLRKSLPKNVSQRQ